MPTLSKRLRTIASLVPFGARVCDIGTDHGYLSIELIKHGDVKAMISTDINEKPLIRARKNIERAGVTGIDLRLCDGLSGIKSGEVDTVVIAGMGGEVIAGIIEKGEAIAKEKGVTLILQPTTSPEALRSFLYKNGYGIIMEIPLEENGKLYSVMVCEYSDEKTEYESYYSFIGKVVPQTKDGFLYIKKQFDRCYKCAKALKNIPEKTDEYEYYNSVATALDSILKTAEE